MKIVTTGSLGNVAKPLVQKLIADGNDVTVITTKDDRRADIEALGATAAVGSISDAMFLKNAFEGTDAVYAMVPPAMGAVNMIRNIEQAGQAYAEAIQSTGVRRVVMLSSIGADATEGNGPIQGVHRIEKIFKQLEHVNVTVLRSGFLMVNLLRDMPLIKNRDLFGNNYGGDIPLPYTHPKDIAAAAASELQRKGDGFEVKYIVGDVSTSHDIARLLGNVIGKPQLTWTELTDEQLKQGMLSGGTPAELVGLITELGQGVREGIITKGFFATGGNITGQITLQQFANEFKTRYEQV